MMTRMSIFTVCLFALLSNCKPSVDPGIDQDYVSDNEDTHPAWSPDGQTIAYTHFETDDQEVDSLNSRYQLWLISPDGSNRRFLTSGSYPSWSPDNQWLAFNIGSSPIIAKIRTDGNGYQQLTSNPDGDHGSYFPAWSPDRKRILFSIHAGPNRGVWMMDHNGKDKKQLTQYSKEPSWFPDGKRFVAKQFNGSRWQILLYDTSGTVLDTVVSYSLDNTISLGSPEVSPDGRKIAFDMSTKNTQKINIYVVNVDGGNLKALTTEGGEDPAWSPDGQQICYAHSERLYTEYIIDYKLWIMNADGSNKRRLTFR